MNFLLYFYFVFWIAQPFCCNRLIIHTKFQISAAQPPANRDSDRASWFQSTLFQPENVNGIIFFSFIYFFCSGKILTWVDGAVFVDGGQDAGKRTAGFLLNLVTGQQFKLLWSDCWKAIKLEGEVDVVGPVGRNAGWRYPDKRQSWVNLQSHADGLFSCLLTHECKNKYMGGCEEINSSNLSLKIWQRQC